MVASVRFVSWPNCNSPPRQFDCYSVTHYSDICSNALVLIECRGWSSMISSSVLWIKYVRNYLMKNVDDHVRNFSQVIYLACFVQFWIILYNLNTIKLYQNSGALFLLLCLCTIIVSMFILLHLCWKCCKKNPLREGVIMLQKETHRMYHNCSFDIFKKIVISFVSLFSILSMNWFHFYALFGSEMKLKGKIVKRMNVKGMKVSRKWNVFFIVC
jgi:hypothetical protein